MSFEKAISTIIELNEEFKAIEILIACIKGNMNKIESENAEMSSCIRAIQKINRDKNEAISALCERDW